ncbi:hypothetical protein SAMD00019534_009760 [Acytostelium subglobosum LB1]|uniref:hypothetical protein n=1 Tax=Acytostelium subglobosum LB1 TaxID=1410327 RepID=UPI0006451EAC|nr:hypothetical protein SAMD00019534_009760 [Acytostelium subglobosum LB1]GAM17801.1 hypothetical protein SAMD00019534_009760 [Acytostelium subglobosum LB1]|eukprot:XP_012758397.1 hypothetical protein SAMD00019534_009760 [Acytostelium subglobosum LB1]
MSQKKSTSSTTGKQSVVAAVSTSAQQKPKTSASAPSTVATKTNTTKPAATASTTTTVKPSTIKTTAKSSTVASTSQSTTTTSTSKKQQQQQQQPQHPLIGRIITPEIVSERSQYVDITYIDPETKQRWTTSVHLTEISDVNNNPFQFLLPPKEEDIPKNYQQQQTETTTTTKVAPVITITGVNEADHTFSVSFEGKAKQAAIKPGVTLPCWVVGRSSDKVTDMVVIINRNTIGLIDIMTNFDSMHTVSNLLKFKWSALSAMVLAVEKSGAVRLALPEAANMPKIAVGTKCLALVREITPTSLKVGLPRGLSAEVRPTDVHMQTHPSAPFSIYQKNDLIEVDVLFMMTAGKIYVRPKCFKYNPAHKKPRAIKRRIMLEEKLSTTGTAGFGYVLAVYSDMARVLLSTRVEGVLLLKDIHPVIQSFIVPGKPIAVTTKPDLKEEGDIKICTATITDNFVALKKGEVSPLTVLGVYTKHIVVKTIHNERGVIFAMNITAGMTYTAEQLAEHFQVGDHLLGVCQQEKTAERGYVFSLLESDMEGIDLEAIIKPPWSVDDEPEEAPKPHTYVDVASMIQGLSTVETNTTPAAASAPEATNQAMSIHVQADGGATIKWVEEDFAAMADGLDKKRKRAAGGAGEDMADAEEDAIDEDEIQDEKKQKKEKKMSRTQAENQIKQKEDMLSDHNVAPESAQDFERVLMGSPNSSFVWMKYMAFYLGMSEIQKAREIGEKALKKIIPTEVLELRNVWTALLNLENMYGTKDTLLKLFQRAIQYQDPKSMYFSIVNILEQTQKFDLEDEYFKMFFKKYRHSAKVWCRYGEFLLTANKVDVFRGVLAKVMTILAKKKQVEVISKYAQLEFKMGDIERGRTIFEGLVSSYPSRSDLWNVYLDMELKASHQKNIRQLFERCITLKFSDRNIKQFFKRYLEYEKINGDARSVDHVKSAALSYVENGGNKTSSGAAPSVSTPSSKL